MRMNILHEVQESVGVSGSDESLLVEKETHTHICITQRPMAETVLKISEDVRPKCEGSTMGSMLVRV